MRIHLALLAFLAADALAQNPAPLNGGGPIAQVPQLTQKLQILCVPDGMRPPNGFGPIELMTAEGKPLKVGCACKTSVAYTKLALNALSVGGAYKLLKITHDTSLADVTKELKRLELPDRVVERSSPRLHRVATGKLARSGSVAGLALAVVILAEETWSQSEAGASSQSRRAGLPAASPELLNVPTAYERRRQRDLCSKSIDMTVTLSHR